MIERVGKDLEMTKAIRPADPEAFEISVNGKVYTDKKEGGKALMDALYSGKKSSHGRAVFGKGRYAGRGVLRFQDFNEPYDLYGNGA